MESVTATLKNINITTVIRETNIRFQHVYLSFQKAYGKMNGSLNSCNQTCPCERLERRLALIESCIFVIITIIKSQIIKP